MFRLSRGKDPKTTSLSYGPKRRILEWGTCRFHCNKLFHQSKNRRRGGGNVLDLPWDRRWVRVPIPIQSDRQEWKRGTWVEIWVPVEVPILFLRPIHRSNEDLTCLVDNPTGWSYWLERKLLRRCHSDVFRPESFEYLPFRWSLRIGRKSRSILRLLFACK